MKLSKGHTKKENNSHKQKRPGKNRDIKEVFSKWFSVVTSVTASGPMLKSKSQELAKKLDHLDFKVMAGSSSSFEQLVANIMQGNVYIDYTALVLTLGLRVFS